MRSSNGIPIIFLACIRGQKWLVAVGYLFLAQDLRQGTAAPDETEDLRLRAAPLVEALALAQNDAINDGFSLARLYGAWHHLQSRLGRGA